MHEVIFYQSSRGEYPVKEFLDDLDKKARAKVYQHLMLLEKEGPNLLRPYADHVRGKIRELRVRFSSVNVRIFYFFFVREQIVLLHAFSKKTQELPEKEIEQAERNMKDWIDREDI
jgi:phage-related protein